MKKTLGIYVTSDRHLDQLMQLCKTAKKKGVAVSVFFTHLGTLLTLDPRFKELDGLAEITLCKVAFESHGLDKNSAPGISENGFVTQAKHAEIIEDCDRCVVF